MPYDDMTDTEFEEFCFELMRELGFVNVDWRKGTGLNASPADGGRDIVAERQIEEFDGSVHLERWFVDCKKYQRGVPPDKITGLLAWATAERANVALVIASSFLSNPCKDYLKTYELNNRPPFRVKYWERPQLGKMLEGRDEFVARYVDSRPRTEAEIVAAEEVRTNKLWYYRKEVLFHNVEIGRREPLEPEMEQKIREAMRWMEERHSDDPTFVIPGGEHETWNVAYLLGELSALRWVLGDDWNNGDS
ncbi:restriction endonuclease [Streptomyces phaeochromogenes]|uniref:restriction endonuclease n=1 Tax=Streptomyces phaeochromogenes TaxID=1923 RepID=UPI002DDACDDB|nr:restriction endonuclease [Streptomyces phaeochromogenes]WRZ29983.1 restriction endonuclease [Streptomyces phaeochromogenes]